MTTFPDRIGRLAIAALAVLAVAPGVADAAPAGTPDPTFDGDGRLILPFGGAPAAVFTLPDGKIVSAGTSSAQDFAVWRLTAAGGLDKTFGRGGTAVADFGGNEYASAGAIGPGGKIVVSGDGQLARFTPAGALDRTFGPGGPEGDGKVVLDISGDWYPSDGMLVEPDGRILVGGNQSGGTQRDFAIKRLKSDGSYDMTFDLVDFGADDFPLYLAHAPGGKIVAAGTSQMNNSYVVAVARYTAEGKPDETFGDKGKATLGPGQPTAVVVGADSTVLVAGRFGEQTKRLGVKRLTAGGAPDAGYGDEGLALPGFLETSTTGSLAPVALRPDGRLALAGLDVDYNLAVTRFGATGAFDPAFGPGGTTSVDFGDVALPTAATVQPDGKLVVAGAALQGLRPRLAFARLLGDASPPSGGGTPPPPVLRCAGRRATIVGTPGRDRLRGTPRADVIVALGGADRVVARGGKDIVCGGAGDDRLSGGAGRDVLRGEQGRDRLLGGAGRDRLVGGPGRDLVRR